MRAELRPPDPLPGARLREVLTSLADWDEAGATERRAAARWVAEQFEDFTLDRLWTFACGGQKREVAVFTHLRTRMRFSLVPGGKFLMGSYPTESGRTDAEELRAVTLPTPYLIAQTELTFRAWLSARGRMRKGWKQGSSHPVDGVSWLEAREFCVQIGLELPTEAQWEHACRAGTRTAYSFGGNPAELSRYAWYFINSGRRELPLDTDWGKGVWHVVTETWGCRPHQVATRPPNAFGLFDMHGNQFEWCSDDLGPDEYGVESERLRPVRGGSWYHPAAMARSAGRVEVGERFSVSFLGFRPVKNIKLK